MKQHFFVKKSLSKGIAKVLSLSLCSAIALPAMGQSEGDEIALLRAQIEALSSRLEQLEVNNSEMAEKVESVEESAKSDSWVSNIKFNGDLRTRYERHDDEAKPSARNRARIRARVGVTADVSEDWVMSVGLASGSDDPVSTNQTLGGGSTTKNFGLDYAFFEYHGFEDVMVTGGKYKNVFFKPGGSGQNLIFDGDFRPEGLGLKYDGGNFFFNTATMYIESDDKAGSQDEEMMWGMQVGYEINLDDAQLTLGGSYYEASVQGSMPFYNNKSYRNTLDGTGAYLNNYEELEIFADYRTTYGDMPLRLFVDYVQNLDADTNDQGWAIGGKLGDVKNAGDWEIGYTYQDLEADAVYAALTDSDFGGGGSDDNGHIFNFAFGISKKTEAGITYFMNEYGEGGTGIAQDFNRLHVYMSTGF